MSRNPDEIETNSDEILELRGHIFDLARQELRTAEGNLVPLRAQSAKIFAILGKSPNEIVAKDALIDAVWRDTIVTDDSLVQCIADIRRALGAAGHDTVETFPKKGYRLNIHPLPKNAMSGSWLAARDDAIPPARPAIAVMAFDDLSHGANQGYLSDAISEGIITELTRFREFSVIARHSSFKYRGAATDVRVVADELGVHYVLEGSQQVDGDRLRVTAQLIDAPSGRHVWADVYDRDLTDIFAVQTEIVRTITSTVGLKVAYRPPPTGELSNLSALRYHLEARTHVRQTTREAVEKGRLLNLKAIEADPNSPYGYIGMAFVYWHKHNKDWVDGDRAGALQKAVEYAEKALGLDPENYSAHYARGCVHFLAGELDLATVRLKRALELNPSATNVMLLLANPLIYKGRAKEALALVEHAMEIDSHNPEWSHMIHAKALWTVGDYEAALAAIQKIGKLPNMSRRTLAAIYVCLGRQAEAEAAIAALLREQPDFSISVERESEAVKYENKEALERWLDALRRAGLPE